VDGWSRGGWFWVETWGRPSSGWRHWLVHRDGIVKVIFELRTHWAPNIETK
jgi:hypothetical protein